MVCYKVLVMTVDEQLASDTLARFTPLPGQELTLDIASAMIGTWNGLAKRSGKEQGTKSGFEANATPMKRSVAFARDIKTSKQISAAFPSLIANHVEALNEASAVNDISLLNTNIRMASNHVDGSMNAMERESLLTWLESPVPDDETRMLTNARCLSEGVDVPALDSVVFFNPRNSMVDVVQSVGRVMRRSEGKDYGYIILPVAVPPGVEPSVVLNDNKRFRVVWQILNALRAHDDRFNAKVNSIALNEGNLEDLPVEHNHISDNSKNTAPADGFEDNNELNQFVLFSLEKWQEALYTKLVDKVGSRTYWEDWADDVADIAAAQITRIDSLLDGADGTLSAEFDKFVEGLRGNLNNSITRDEAVNMLSQHLITAPVFDALFSEHNFASHNPVSQVMQRMVDALDDAQLDAETEKLESFYASVRMRATDVTSASGKQTVIKDLYERFFKKAFPKQSNSLGIVYTPIEVVDFILRAVDDIARLHFGKSLSDEGVHVLDPFTGTGTFLVRLLQSGIIRPGDLARKYASELHATEITLLAYYVAAVNIETTYQALLEEQSRRNGTSTPDYTPFNGIALADTFQISEEDDKLDVEVFRRNNERIQRQRNAPIHVVIGNPPWTDGQDSADDFNSRMEYPSLDSRVSRTYTALSSAQKTKKDSYIRAFRWASDRIQNRGIVAFVTNGGWLEGVSNDGMRKAFQSEFSEIYIINLRGNQRVVGENSEREGGKVFGSGSRATVAITIAVKKHRSAPAKIRYFGARDFMTAAEKLELLANSTIANIDWSEIVPNSFGDWINQRGKDLLSFVPMSSSSGDIGIFKNSGPGVSTNRDQWAYSFSKSNLKQQVENSIQYFNQWIGSAYQPDPTQLKWSASLATRHKNGNPLRFDKYSIQAAMYRPFQKQWLYTEKGYLDRPKLLEWAYPNSNVRNPAIVVTGIGASNGFSTFSTDLPPNLHIQNSGQVFPRWSLEPITSPDGMIDWFAENGETPITPSENADKAVKGFRRVDNITDEIHMLYQNNLGTDITKDDIFFFVYGQLHDPKYREAYAADLNKMLPRLETPKKRERFDQLAAAGQKLMQLHVNYEEVEPWPVTVEIAPSVDPTDRETWRVGKLKWARVKDPESRKPVDDLTTIIYNPSVTIRNIPTEVTRYQLGARSPLEWIIDRFQVKKNKASGIVNDPNDWADEIRNPRYIVDLIARVTRVAVETAEIVESLRED